MGDNTARGSRTFLTQGRDERGTAYPHEDNHNGVATEATRLQQKVLELKQMDQLLVNTKEDYLQRSRDLKKRERAFLEKQQEMIESIRKFKAFVLETDSKRNRALQKAAEERKTIEKQTVLVTDLTSKLDGLNAKRDHLIKRYEELKPHQDYLEAVVAGSDEFADVLELVTRHTILSETHDDLRNDAQRVQTQIETLQTNFQTMMKEKQNEILVRNSQLAQLQKTLEDVSRKAVTQENEVEALEIKGKETVSKFGQIDMAIRNLYERVLASKDLSQHKKKRAHARIAEEGAKAGEQVSRSIRDERLLKYLSQLLDEVGQRVAELIDISQIPFELPTTTKRTSGPYAKPARGEQLNQSVSKHQSMEGSGIRPARKAKGGEDSGDVADDTVSQISKGSRIEKRSVISHSQTADRLSEFSH